MRPLRWTAEANAVLNRIRTYPWTLSVYGMSQSRAWRLVEARVRRHIDDAGIVRHERNQYRLCVREMLKSFRTQTGPPLAKEIELVIRKWVNFGQRPALLQELLCICFLRFEQTGYAGPWPKPEPGKKRGPKSRRLPRRSYEKALGKGRISRGRSNMVEAQAAKHKAGSAHAAEIADKLRPVLAAHGIPGNRFVSYFAFAQRLGRLSRKYAGRTLAGAASDLVDLYEAKSLDREVLLAIAEVVAGLSDLA